MASIERRVVEVELAQLRSSSRNDDLDEIAVAIYLEEALQIVLPERSLRSGLLRSEQGVLDIVDAERRGA